MEFRLLKAEEIDVRVQSTKKTGKGVGCILLLYKDARVDMNILDETYGANNWQRTHEVINNNLFCNIDVWDSEKGCWVRKQDVGVESNTEKEKGQASDSFKRAGFNWGIGRELYSSPFIWVDLQEGEYTESNGKVTVSAFVKFSVKSIDYTDRVITSLEIQDNKNTVRYALETKKPSGQPNTPKNQNNSTMKPTEGKKLDTNKIIELARKKNLSQEGLKAIMLREIKKDTFKDITEVQLERLEIAINEVK